eukprot:403330943
MIKNLDRVVHISLGFLLVLLSFNSCASISSKLLKDQGFKSLGNVSLALTYVIVACGSPFASALVMKTNSRLAVLIGSIAYLFYVLGLFLPTIREHYPDSDLFLFDKGFVTFIILLCSCIKGFGGSMFWVGGLSYIRECASDQLKGLFFAVLYSFANSSHLIGSLMSAFILGNTDKVVYFFIMSGISLCSVLCMIFLRKPEKVIIPLNLESHSNQQREKNKLEETQIEDPHQSETQEINDQEQNQKLQGLADYKKQSQSEQLQIMKLDQRDQQIQPNSNDQANLINPSPQRLHVHTKSVVSMNENNSKLLISPTVRSTLISRDSEVIQDVANDLSVINTKPSIKQIFLNQYELAKTPKMQLMLMYIVTVSLAGGIPLSIFVSLVSETMHGTHDQQEQLFYSMLVMSVQGLGQIFGGFILDKVIKRYRSNRLGIICVAITSILAFGTLILYTSIYEYSFLAYVFGFFFGVLDSSSSTHASMLIGFEFEDKSVIAFGLQNFIKCAFLGFNALVSGFIDQQWQYITYFSCLFVYFLIAYTIMYFKFPFSKVQ